MDSYDDKDVLGKKRKSQVIRRLYAIHERGVLGMSDEKDNAVASSLDLFLHKYVRLLRISREQPLWQQGNKRNS